MAVLLAFGAGRAVVAVVTAWRAGAFFPKSYLDQVLGLKDEQLAELRSRYEASQDGLRTWRRTSEAALKTAEQAQANVNAVMAELALVRQQLAAAQDVVVRDTAAVRTAVEANGAAIAVLREEVDAAREELHQARAWRDLGPNPLEPQPPPPRLPPGGRGGRGGG